MHVKLYCIQKYKHISIKILGFNFAFKFSSTMATRPRFVHDLAGSFDQASAPIAAPVASNAPASSYGCHSSSWCCRPATCGYRTTPTVYGSHASNDGFTFQPLTPPRRADACHPSRCCMTPALSCSPSTCPTTKVLESINCKYKRI
jgi:hypothetical protein